MSLILNSNSSPILLRNHPNHTPLSTSANFLSFPTKSKFASSIRSSYTYSFNDPADPSSESVSSSVDDSAGKPDLGSESPSELSDLSTPKYDDEWGGSGVELGNGGPVADGVASRSVTEERRWELKQALVDTVYGSDFGFRASTEVRGEVLELVSQLEAVNPTSSSTECPEWLDGNWVLVYTAFSELLPLLAAGSIPFVKVEKICQLINTSTLTIENIATVSNPITTLSFSASASFEVRSPSRIQVEFKEGVFNPPEVKSSIDLPESASVFGQNVNLSFLQQSLSPLQRVLAGISGVLSGQPPLRIPIPGGRTKSWLLTTYLDKDFRISRGDGGLFVLVKEGSPLLDY